MRVADVVFGCVRRKTQAGARMVARRGARAVLI